MGSVPVARCACCGKTSPLGALFVRSPAFWQAGRRWCPGCAARERHSLRVLLFSAALIAAAWGAWLAVTQDGHRVTTVEVTWLLANLALLWGFLFVAVAAHQLGHVVAARVAGLQVCFVSLGVGPRLLRRPIRGAVVKVHAIPAEGYVIAGRGDTAGWRWRWTVFLVAGPLTNVLLAYGVAVVTLAAAPHRWAVPQDVLAAAGRAPLLPELFALANVFAGVAGSLFPAASWVTRNIVLSDGAQLVWVWRHPPPDPQSHAPNWLARQGALLVATRQREAALDVLRRATEAHPTSADIHYTLAVADGAVNRWPEARHRFLCIAAQMPTDQPLGAMALGGWAFCNLMIGTPELLAEADVCAGAALYRMPWSEAFKATWGAVLVERGDLANGEAQLRAALADARDDDERALATAFLALAALRQGDPARARKLLRKARRLDPESPVLPRISQEVSPEGGST